MKKLQNRLFTAWGLLPEPHCLSSDLKSSSLFLIMNSYDPLPACLLLLLAVQTYFPFIIIEFTKNFCPSIICSSSTKISTGYVPCWVRMSPPTVPQGPLIEYLILVLVKINDLNRNNFLWYLIVCEGCFKRVPMYSPAGLSYLSSAKPGIF